MRGVVVMSARMSARSAFAHVTSCIGGSGCVLSFFLVLQAISHLFFFFFLNDTAPPEISTFPLPDPLPISPAHVEQPAPVAHYPLRRCHRAVRRREVPAVGERIGRHIHDADEDGVIEIEGATPAERPAARRVDVARQEAAQLRRQALEPWGQAVGARERRESAGWCAHQRPALAGEHVGTALRPPTYQRFALRFGDLFQEDDEGLHAGRGEPGRLCVPAAGRERRAHRFRGVWSERGELHRTGLAGYDARSALTMLRRAARTAGRKPPTMPITTAKISALVMTPGDSANPKPISEKLPKLRVETRAKDSSEASPTPAAPPAVASSTDSTRNAVSTLRRWNPKARRVPTSTTRLATAAYIVIIAPIIAPTLKMVVTTRPRILMNFAIACDCSR